MSLVSPDIFKAVAVSGTGSVAALRVTSLQNIAVNFYLVGLGGSQPWISVLQREHRSGRWSAWLS